MKSLTMKSVTMKGVISFLFAIFAINHWCRNYQTMPDEMDKYINDLIDSGEKVKVIDRYVIQLGDLYMWAANYPYASYNLMKKEKLFTGYKGNDHFTYNEIRPELLPKRHTVHRIRKLHLEAMK